MQKLKEHLEKNGVHPSYHRLRILHYLFNNLSHPTVEMIYQDISQDVPTLSKTTIYNTLYLFLDKKLITGLTIDENEVRYDHNLDPHAHFKCKKCGTIYDLNLKSSIFDQDRVEGHKITEYHIYFKGHCIKCNGGHSRTPRKARSKN